MELLPNDRPRRVLFAAQTCYLDDSNGAIVASRAMMDTLTLCGFAVEGLTGTIFESPFKVDPRSWLSERCIEFEEHYAVSLSLDARGVRASDPIHYRLRVRDVPVTLHRSVINAAHEPDDVEVTEFLRLFDATIERFQPDVLVNYGGDRLSRQIRQRARGKGIAVVFALHNFNYTSSDAFRDCDAVVVPSRFASDYYRKNLGINCHILPNPVDAGRVRAVCREAGYVTFINPSREKGVFPFVRIAEQMGRLRPDIPFLVVESRGSEETLVGCGLDLRPYGNVFLMSHTNDPRDFWRMTRILLLPSLWWENQPLVAVEAMINGIPVIGSDRGGIPEVLGGAGLLIVRKVMSD